MKKRLPAGLMDDNVEFFFYHGEPFYMRNGNVFGFNDWELDVLTALREAIEEDPKVTRAFEIMHIYDPSRQLHMFATCRFCGDFDETPDISKDGIMFSEYAECCEKNCPGRNLICQLPEAKNGALTPREIEVMKLIVEDLPDKIISSMLGMSCNTMAIHRRHIEEKVGCHTKVGIAVFAKDHNIC